MHMMRMFSAAVVLFAVPAYAADLPEMNEPQLVMPVSHGISLAARPTINRCNAAIAEWAAQYNPVAIETNLSKSVRGSSGGGQTATLFVKIDYLREGGIEPRSATIACTVTADGQVSVAVVKQG